MPRGGKARVRATAAGGAFDEAVIHIIPRGRYVPAPSVPGRVGDGNARNALSRPRVARHRRWLLVKVRSKRAGSVEVSARLRGRRVGRCRVRAPAGRAVVCGMQLPRRFAEAALYCPVPRVARLGLDGTRILVRLRVGGRVVAVRRLQL